MTTQELVERLRGTYRIPITDGLGPAGGEEPGNADFFVRTFPTSPLATRAADRISDMDAENKRLREACLQAALTFRFYEQSHLAKKTQDGDEKAHRNHEMASMCEAALEPQQKEPRS